MNAKEERGSPECPPPSFPVFRAASWREKRIFCHPEEQAGTRDVGTLSTS